MCGGFLWTQKIQIKAESKQPLTKLTLFKTKFGINWNGKMTGQLSAWIVCLNRRCSWPGLWLVQHSEAVGSAQSYVSTHAAITLDVVRMQE